MISLSKGQKVSLAKEAPGLSKMIVGLGWDVNKKKFGFFSDDFDLDASAFVCRNGKLTSSSDICYFGNKRAFSGAVTHCGDNLTGDGDGDDEQIIIDLDKLPSDVDKIVLVVNIYNASRRKQDFGSVSNAFVRICNEADGSEILKFSLTENYSGFSSMVFGELYKHNGEWKFNPIGQGIKEESIKKIASLYK